MTTTTDRPEVLRPPRVPQRCPVSLLHIRTENTRSGNSRAAIIVRDQRGRNVEIIEHGAEGDSRALARYPWASSSLARCYGLTEGQAWPLLLNVAPSEYRRLVALDVDPDTERIRRMADRCEMWAGVREAVNGAMADGGGGRWIYHRPGEMVGAHLARVLPQLVRAGWLVRLDDPSTSAPDCSRYVAGPNAEWIG